MLPISDTLPEFIISGKVKKQENYTNGILTYVEYFLDQSETKTQIKLLYQGVGISFYIIELSQGLYRRYLVEDYDNNHIIDGRRIEVLNENNDIIYSSIIDINTNTPIAIFKSAYDDNGDYLYEFEYNLDGTLNQVDIMIADDYHPTGTFYPQDIGVDPEVHFSWNGFEYYQNALPVIPA